MANTNYGINTASTGTTTAPVGSTNADLDYIRSLTELAAQDINKRKQQAVSGAQQGFAQSGYAGVGQAQVIGGLESEAASDIQKVMGGYAAERYKNQADIAQEGNVANRSQWEKMADFVRTTYGDLIDSGNVTAIPAQYQQYLGINPYTTGTSGYGAPTTGGATGGGTSAGTPTSYTADQIRYHLNYSKEANTAGGGWEQGTGYGGKFYTIDPTTGQKEYVSKLQDLKDIQSSGVEVYRMNQTPVVADNMPAIEFATSTLNLNKTELTKLVYNYKPVAGGKTLNQTINDYVDSKVLPIMQAINAEPSLSAEAKASEIKRLTLGAATTKGMFSNSNAGTPSPAPTTPGAPPATSNSAVTVQSEMLKGAGAPASVYNNQEYVVASLSGDNAVAAAALAKSIPAVNSNVQGDYQSLQDTISYGVKKGYWNEYKYLIIDGKLMSFADESAYTRWKNSR